MSLAQRTNGSDVFLTQTDIVYSIYHCPPWATMGSAITLQVGKLRAFPLTSRILLTVTSAAPQARILPILGFTNRLSQITGIYCF